MKSKIEFLDYFFVLRPTLFIPVWTVFLAGYHANLSFDINKKLSPLEMINENNLILAILLLTMLTGAVYVFNQIKDIETDAKNQKIFFVATKIISKKNAWIEGILLTLLSVGGAFILEFKLGLSFLFILLFAGILYSFEPFNWKDKPIWGVIAHLCGGWSVAACGWIAAGTTNSSCCFYAIPYGLALVSVYLLTAIPDIPGDRESGKITFAVKYGVKITTIFALLFEALTVIASFLTKDYVLFIPGLAAFPLFVFAAFQRKTKNIIRAVKFTILFASLSVCVKFPMYFLVILFVFYFSKWYYRKRFNLEYPKFAA